MNIIYVSYLEPNYSRSGVHFNFLINTDNVQHKVNFFLFPQGFFAKWKSLRRFMGEYGRDNSHVVVMSPASSLVIYLRLLGFKKIILDGGWPLSDASKIRKSSPLVLYLDWIIDLVSIHLCKRFICESNEQQLEIHHKFKVKLSKLKVNYTGFLQKEFTTSLSVKDEVRRFVFDKNYVLFRGKPNKEAGLDTIITAAKLLENQVNFVIASPRYFCEEKPSNVLILDDYLKSYEITTLYREAYLVLGQMSDDERLSRTIPHKFFEAAFFGKCYVSARTKPIRNICKEAIFEVQGGNGVELAERILDLFGSPEVVRNAEAAIKKTYRERFDPEILTHQFVEILREI